MLPPKIWIICRVCLKQQDKLYNIFENRFFTKMWCILRDCGGVPVRQNDNFSDKICERCLNRLWEAYDFRIDCQRSHRDMVQKQLNWRIAITELELKNEMKNCLEFSAVSDGTKISSSSRDDISSFSSTINTKSLNWNNINNEFKEFTNNDETKNPKAVEEIHNLNMKQYCVVTENNIVDEQVESNEQKIIEEPIVLRFKVKNKESNENKPTIGYDLMKANNNNESINQSATIKESNEINMNVKLKTDLSSNKSFKSSSSKGSNCKLRCKKCKKKCKTFIDLQHHMYTHIKPHQCNICQKKFSQSHALLSHANKHAGTKPFYCRICFKSFADLSNRNGHERAANYFHVVHTLFRRNVNFTYEKVLETLKIAQQRHLTGNHATSHVQKKFKCTKCSKLFRFQTLLNKHVRSHKPIKCMICDREFSSVQNVRNHHQRVHLKSLFNTKN